MVRRRWILRTLLAAAILLFLAVTVALLSLPRLLHTVAVWRLEAMTKRPVTIEAIEFRLRTARFSVRGLRVTDHDGSPFLTVQSLEGRLHRRSLLQGQVWIEDVALTGGDVRIVRTGPDRFNISDLLTSKEPSTGFALTVDHLLLQGVSVVVEDRVLSPPRTWRADDIRLEATSLGTAAPRGVAFASATVAGALLSVRVMNIQLYPLHLNAEANIRDLDLTLADLYMPPDSPVMVESGVVHAAVSLDMDAKAGLTLDAEGVVEQLAVGRLDVAGDEVTSPAVRFLVRELQQKTGTVGLRYASLEGDVTVIDPTTSPPTPLKLKDVIATVSNLQEGLKGSAGVALYGTLPGVGEVDVSGSAGLAPPRADVRVRARSINLGFLSHYLPLEARMSGVGTADLRVVATQDRTLAVTVTGDVTLDKVTVADEEQTPVTVKRIAARGFAYTYPATVRVADLALTEPSTLVERAADGTLNLAALGRLRPPPPGAPVPSAPAASAAAVTPDVAVRRLSVVRGRARVTDNVVNSRVEVSALELTAEDLTWPSKGPARVRLSTDVAGARLGARGTVDLGPRRGTFAVTARKIDLATLQPWLPPAAGQLRGTAEADVTLTLGLQPLSVEARGTVNGARLSWTDAVHPTVNLATLDIKAEDDVTWPSKGPARVRVVSDVAGGRVAAHGTVDLGQRHTNLTVNARRVDLAAAQPWLPAGTVLRGTADADVTLALGLEPLSVEAKGAVTGAKLAYTDGTRPTVNLAALDVRADENVTWPSKGPARVRVAVEVPGGRIGARGPVDIGARKGDLAIKATSVDLAALQPWLPIVGQIRGAGDADVEVSVGLEPFTLALKGRLGAGNLAFLEGTKPLITVTRVDATGIDLVWPTKVSIDRLHVNTPWAEVARNRQGELSLRALFRRRPDLPRPAPPAPDTVAAAPGPLPGMQVTLREAIFENGGGRIIDDNVEPAARFDLAGSHLELRNVSWPSRGAANVLFSTPMPGSGTLKARGTFSIEPTKLALDAELDQVDLAPGRPYLPFNARVAGKLTGKAKLNGTFDDTIALVIDGDAVVDRLRIGDADRRLVTADKVDLAGFRYSFPTSVRIRETTLTKPWMLIERHSDGTVELVELFKARHGLPTKAENVSIQPPSAKPAPPARVRAVFNKFVMKDGFIRFVDRTTSPAYAEELSKVSVIGENLGTTPQRQGAPPRRGTLELRGQFASGTPLTVRAQIGSYPGPFYLDVVVDVADFAVPRLNPYLDRLSSWVARQGTLTATLKYHIEGDDLEALNDVRIDGLDLEQGGHGGEFTKRTGLPLNTLVSLLKDRKGVIKLSIPVRGRLSSPEFQYSEAVWAALRNLTIKLVALPFSLVGKLFFTEDSRIESLQIDPVTFQTARAAPDTAGAKQLGQLATFLKETPDIRLRMRPVTTVADVTALRRQALESRLATLGSDEAARRQAAVGLYTELFPRRDPPTSDEALYDELARETPTPPRALGALTTDRVKAVHETLVRTGVPAERLERLESRAAVESEGMPRVEFEIAR